jgi:hypothetical protein
MRMMGIHLRLSKAIAIVMSDSYNGWGGARLRGSPSQHINAAKPCYTYMRVDSM